MSLCMCLSPTRCVGMVVGVICYKLTWESEKKLENRLNRKATKRIRKRPVRVWLDGCFDLMHLGHANAFRQAKKLGDILIVGVNSDKDILHYKGAPGPLFNNEERAAAVR